MQRFALIVIILILSFSISSCSKQINKEDVSSPANGISQENSVITSMTEEEFKKRAEEKGLNKRMIRTLDNLGFSHEEIIGLPPEEIARIFAPGTHLDGGGFDPDSSQVEQLKKIGIDVEMSVILFNLGYDYEDMLELTSEEIDFIFPNTELIQNLVNKGYAKEEVQKWAVFEAGKTYKEIIKEALKK